jgi:single-stranded-DNA-specific exonuclease
MAAGFGLQAECSPEFRRALSQTVGEMISEIDYQPTLQIDGFLPLVDLSIELVADLERLAPFGPGNPNLVFVSSKIQFKRSRSLGRSGDHLLVRLEDSTGSEFKAVWWGGGIEQLPEWMVRGAQLDLAYTVRSRDYQGKKELQVEWLEARPVEGEHIEVATQLPEIEVIDHRGVSAPMMELKKIISQEKDILIWAEAQAKEKLAELGMQTNNRASLEAATELVIWTTPSGPQELSSVVDRVSPTVVHLFNVNPGMDEMKDFTERLLGLAKYALRKTKGKISVSLLGAATAQRGETVRVGLQWLVARGYLVVHYENEDEICFSEGDGVPVEDLERLAKQLREQLAETAAYRRYYSSAEADLLFGEILEK